MPTIDINLPTELEKFLAERAAANGFPDTGAYIVDVLQTTRAVEESGSWEAKLREGIEALDRGEGRAMTTADWDRLRTQIRQRYHISEEE